MGKDTRKLKLTDKQQKLVVLLANNHKLHEAQRVSRGVIYTQAGYSSINPDQGVASAIRKKHIQSALLRLDPSFFDGKGTSRMPSEAQTPSDEAEANLKLWSGRSSQGANNYALYLLKKKEAGIIEQAVDRVLLSPFLSEAELDAFDEAIPQDVVVATLADRPDEGANAETPAIIDERVNDE
jgi:hypothetical protein